jgi:Glycosyltransferase
MKQAYYIDTFSTGHLHEMFNASSLQMFAAMYDHIEYRASRSSYEHVVQLLGNLPDNVTYHPIAVANAYKGWKRMRFLLKQLQALFHNVKYILCCPKNCDIIFNYNTLAALPAMNKAAMHTKKRILQVCHGEMAELAMQYSKNRLLRRGVRLLQSGKQIASNLYFAVLGKAIYNNVYPLVGEGIQKRLLFFEHSAIMESLKEKPKKGTDKLIIGTIGAMRESKGESTLIKLADKLKGRADVEIRCIGKYTLQKQVMEEAGIVVPDLSANMFFTREELYDQIRQLDYALFLFPRDLYKYTASGSVFDAIACGTPILSLTNDYFEGLFATYGDFGYLEKDLDALAQRIIWLTVHEKEKIDWDMQGLQMAISPRNVAEQFKKHWLVKQES